MNESRKRYKIAMHTLDEIEKGLIGLRSLMQLITTLYAAKRFKPLYGPMRDFNEGLKQLKEETFEGFNYNANHQRCR